MPANRIARHDPTSRVFAVLSCVVVVLAHPKRFELLTPRFVVLVLGATVRIVIDVSGPNREKMERAKVFDPSTPTLEGLRCCATRSRETSSRGKSSGPTSASGSRSAAP